MAMDSQLKRSSSVQMLLFSIQALQFPTNSFTVFIRQAVAHMYAGIQAAFSGTSILRQMMMHHGS